ncbi:hypothetical protein ACQX0N_12175 [Clostridium tepidum]|jgi:predicted methyltransferase|uniref:Integrase n=1 Tax=Clostridium tepidum TaxID=1962263 RepID=A0A1S9I154_9CLOT|nr:hypothetical protein [Clostridium tepidum]MCR1935525.1 hypothetical protein [Clostridium tepidum]MDU6878805.1 hypothetical protein [Clostridium botulinum]OOO61434.1 hypothetical protein BS637_12405 [Clostridium tepidum]OOO64054.1 hypothetical protein BS638_12140 [Clostridium tepidum]
MPIIIGKEKDDDDRLYVVFNYTPDRVKRIKKIEGHKWNTIEKHWSIPNNKEVIDKIVLTFYDEEVMLDASLI